MARSEERVEAEDPAPVGRDGEPWENEDEEDDELMAKAHARTRAAVQLKQAARAAFPEDAVAARRSVVDGLTDAPTHRNPVRRAAQARLAAIGAAPLDLDEGSVLRAKAVRARPLSPRRSAPPHGAAGSDARSGGQVGRLPRSVAQQRAEEERARRRREAEARAKLVDADELALLSRLDDSAPGGGGGGGEEEGEEEAAGESTVSEALRRGGAVLQVVDADGARQLERQARQLAELRKLAEVQRRELDRVARAAGASAAGGAGAGEAVAGVELADGRVAAYLAAVARVPAALEEREAARALAREEAAAARARAHAARGGHAAPREGATEADGEGGGEAAEGGGRGGAGARGRGGGARAGAPKLTAEGDARQRAAREAAALAELGVDPGAQNVARAATERIGALEEELMRLHGTLQAWDAPRDGGGGGDGGDTPRLAAERPGSASSLGSVGSLSDFPTPQQTPRASGGEAARAPVGAAGAHERGGGGARTLARSEGALRGRGELAARVGLGRRVAGDAGGGGGAGEAIGDLQEELAELRAALRHGARAARRGCPRRGAARRGAERGAAQETARRRWRGAGAGWAGRGAARVEGQLEPLLRVGGARCAMTSPHPPRKRRGAAGGGSASMRAGARVARARARARLGAGPGRRSLRGCA